MNTMQAIFEHQKECNKLRACLPTGPWSSEPDRIEFKHAGLQCLLSRQAIQFHWCGYVGVPKSHPAYGKSDLDLDVHGGITYSQKCGGYICHLTEDEDDLYWFGFDCMHAGDSAPGFEFYGEILESKLPKDRALTPEEKSMVSHLKGLPNPLMDGEYRDVPYVMQETKNLAEQLAEYK